MIVTKNSYKSATFADSKIVTSEKASFTKNSTVSALSRIWLAAIWNADFEEYKR